MYKITSKIKLIGGMLSLIIVAIVIITVVINQTSKQDSMVINVAGKQRMLTQKITKEVLWLQNRALPEFETLDASISEFEQSLEDLMHGNALRGIYAPPKACIRDGLVQVQSLWLPFREYLEAFKRLLGDTKVLKERLPEANEAVLEISDTVVKAMVAQKLEGRYIDDAGRQRMLTQKIAFHSSQYLITGNTDHVGIFFNAYGLYEATLERFLSDPLLNAHAQLRSVLTKNKEVWKAYTQTIMNLMEQQKQLNDTLTYITDINVVLLDTMDSTVDTYTKYSESQRSFLQNFQYAASLVALIIMLYSVLITRKIERHFADFLRHSEAMAATADEDETVQIENTNKDELTLASMHMSQFVEKMNTVLTHAQQAIHESEQAARELAAVSESIDEELNELGLDEASKKDIDRTIDSSEDIVIQSLDELASTSKRLEQLQKNLNTIVSKTQQRG